VTIAATAKVATMIQMRFVAARTRQQYRRLNRWNIVAPDLVQRPSPSPIWIDRHDGHMPA
jgi:hypothetical protein